MLNSLLFAAAFCGVAVLVYMARYSSRVRATHTRLIAAPRATVQARVAELRPWADWSPWLLPTAQQSFASGALGQETSWQWDAGRGGQGSVERLPSKTPGSLRQRIRLQHPFTVDCQSQWEFTARGEQTEVRWSLRGRVGFSARAFSRTVQEALALDLHYGLDRLAQGLEAPAPSHYRFETLGLRPVAACRMVYQTYEGPIKGLPEARQRMLAELQQQLAARGIPSTGPAMAVYVKTNIKLRTTVCDIGWPVAAAGLPGDGDLGPLSVRELPPTRPMWPSCTATPARSSWPGTWPCKRWWPPTFARTSASRRPNTTWTTDPTTPAPRCGFRCCRQRPNMRAAP